MQNFKILCRIRHRTIQDFAQKDLVTVLKKSLSTMSASDFKANEYARVFYLQFPIPIYWYSITLAVVLRTDFQGLS